MKDGGKDFQQKRLVMQIFGMVQGVFFRFESQAKARELGLTGWVKNMPDGSVKIVAEGLSRNLEEFKKWCQSGPKDARVERIEQLWEEAKGEFGDFRIRY